MGRRRLLQLAGAGIVGGLAVGGAAGADPDHPNTIVFDGSNAADATYEFGVSESVVAHGDVGALEVEDSIDGTTVVGTLRGDVDAYRFRGNLTHLDVSGAVEVSLSYSDVTSSGPDRLEILTPQDGSVEYTFDCTGQIEKVLDAGKRSAEDSNDAVTENGDGTWTATGLTGNGYGDSYDLHGDVAAFDPADGQFTLLLNGTETTVSELTGGQSGGGSDDGSGDDGSGDDDAAQKHTLEIVTPSDGSVEYTLTTSGEITKVLDAGKRSAEDSNDAVTENGDGTWTATGLTGNGYGDTLEFVGEATAFEPKQGQFTLYLDGQEVTPYELVGEEQPSHRLEIVTPSDGSVEYTLTTSGEITKDLDAGKRSAEDSNDAVTENGDGTWTATGLTGNGYGDTLEYEGEATAFDPKEGRFGLYLDGQQVTAYELVGEEPPQDGGDSGSVADGGPVGGGQGYGRTVSRSEADYVVRSATELGSALGSASSGDVVYVPGDATVDVGSSSFDVPGGVTLASNRGIDDAPGGLIHTDSEPTDLLTMHGSARITGLRISGPHPGDDRSGSSLARAITVAGTDGEVDNCEVWGFSYAGVYVNGGDGHVHHNVIRECNKTGLGYGVSMNTGNPLIEYNYFNHNRHSVASSGEHYGYVCRYNHFGPKTVKHVIDVHEPGGVRVEVLNNVVEPVTRLADGNCAESVDARPSPDDALLIEGNWFFQTDCTFELAGVENTVIRDNYYGEGAGVTYSDIIPGYDGWRS